MITLLPTLLLSSIVYRAAAVFGEPVVREMLLAARLVGADRAYATGALTAVTDSLAEEVKRQCGFACLQCG